MKVRCKDCKSIRVNKTGDTCTNFINRIYLEKVLGQTDIKAYCDIFNREGDCQEYRRKYWKFWRPR